MIEIESGSPLRSDFLLGAYMRAVERLRTQVERSNRRRIQIPPDELGLAALCEALEWADTLIQHLARGPRDTRHKYIWPPKGEAAELVHAFKWARNRVHHQWRNAVAQRIDRSVSRPGGVTWVWRTLRRDDVGAERDVVGARAYDKVLEGRPVLVALDALAAAFWSQRGWAVTTIDLDQPGHEVRTPITLDGREA